MACFDGSPDDIAPQTLDRLKTLIFEVEIHACKFFMPFRRALLTPSIEELDFTIQDDTLFPGIDWMAFVLCHDNYPTLKELAISFGGDSLQEYTIPFAKTPNLRTLRLDTKPFKVALYPTGTSRGHSLGTLPALHTIDIHDGNSSNCYDFLRDINNNLDKQGDFKSLKRVVVRGGYSEYIRSKIEQLFLGRQVIQWKER